MTTGRGSLHDRAGEGRQEGRHGQTKGSSVRVKEDGLDDTVGRVRSGMFPDPPLGHPGLLTGSEQ